jgi:hypothetical protein
MTTELTSTGRLDSVGPTIAIAAMIDPAVT